MPRLPPLLIFPSAADQAAATGRPSLRTPDIISKICAAIRQNGHTDTHAAALAGVSSSAVSRWRQEDEEFAVLLDTARADFLDARLTEIRETRKRDGSPDWRAQVWLMQVVAPEIYGTPSRRHSLARDKEEKQRAEENAKEANPQYWSQEDQNQLVRSRRYSLERMNGTPEEEARWLGHFALDPSKPAFPGSLALAGAVIPPAPVLTPEEEAQRQSLRARRRVAHAAMVKQDLEMGRPPTPLPWDLVEDDAKAEPAVHAAGARGAENRDDENTTNLPETRDGGVVAAGGEATDHGGKDARESGPQDVSGVEGPQVLSAVEERPRPKFQNATNLPEIRGAGGDTRGEGALRPCSGPVAPTRGTGAASPEHLAPKVQPSNREAGDPKLAAHLAYLAASVAENDRFRATLPGGGALGNYAKLPESHATPDGERLASPEIGVPKAHRPLAGAALAAVEAKEWRRLNRLMEEQWERSTEREMAVAEAAIRDAIPGMWA